MKELPAELAIAVCVKFTPDPERLRPDPATGQPDLAHAAYHTNEFDRNALEAALFLKERHGARVVGVTLVEHEPPREVLLRAVAAGLDALYLVSHPAAGAGDGLVTATLLAAALEEIGAVYEMRRWDLVLCGDASDDGYDGQVGPRLAQALGIVPVTYATGLELRGTTLVARRLLEECVYVVEADLPALVTVGAETNTPRLPHLMRILEAGHKPIERLTWADLAHAELEQARPALQSLGASAPVSRRRRTVIQGEDPQMLARSLVRRLLAAGEVSL